MKQNEKQNNENFFVSRLHSLQKNELVALRRALGSTLQEASGQALQAFYKICPKDESREEAAYLAACTIAYILHYGKGGQPLWECVRAINLSEARLRSLLSNRWVDRDGFFHAKYSRIIRFSVSKGFLPNINEIYSALTNWAGYRIEFIKNYYQY